MPSYEFTVDNAHQEQRLDRFLAAKLTGKASRSEIQKSIKSAGVWINDICEKKADYLVKLNDHIDFDLEERKAFELVAENLDLDIIYEDEALLVVNKPAGMVVHPAPGHYSGTLVNALIGSGRSLSDLGESRRPGIVHRLDKDTSGLVIIAKTNSSHAALSRMFQERSVCKIYHALLCGRLAFEEGQMDEPIGRHPRRRERFAVRFDGEGKEAVTRYRVFKRFRNSTYAEVQILTGRTHQIRVHFAHRGNAVLGDPLYGRKDDRINRPALHARKLVFSHPISGREVSCEAPLPQDFADILKAEEMIG